MKNYVEETTVAVPVHQDGVPANLSQDERDMIKVGKMQETKRNFGLLPMLGFTTVMLCSWEAVFILFLTGLINGGGISLIYGFIVCWIGSLAMCATIAEMASMYPTSGGQYHWVALLAPEKHARFLSWLTGWVSIIGWQAGTLTGFYSSGAIVQGLLVLNYPDYDYQLWHGTLLLYAALVLTVLVNTVGIKMMPFFEGFLLFFHIASFLAVIVPLVYLAPTKNSAEFVFTEFIQASGYSKGLSWLVGLVPSAVLFIGYDGAVHMAEEVKNASLNVPRSMFFTILINGCLGLAIVIALLFCTVDLEAAITSPTGWPFIEIFHSATRSRAGATAMTSVIIVLVACASLGYLASSSRQLWAFARDRGIPYHEKVAKIDPRFTIPMYAIGITSVIQILLGLISVGSTVTLNAIISLAVAGLCSSYLITTALLIRKRWRGDHLPWGPWCLGRWGMPINIVAMVYTSVVMVFSFFPPAVPVTLVSMNWSSVIFVGFTVIGLVYYGLFARHVYEGPVVNRRFGADNSGQQSTGQ